MKSYRRLGVLILIIVQSLLVVSCVPAVQQQIAADDYFAPVGRNAAPDSVAAEPGRPVVLNRSLKLRKTETVQDLAELIRQQNARLDEVLNQITVLAVRQDTRMNEAEQNPKKKTVLDSMMNNNDRVTVDLLMEMIKEQNQRLNEVIVQLKSLALNQNSAMPQRFGSSLSVPMRVIHKEQPALTYEEAIRLYESNRYKKAKQAFQALRDGGEKAGLADHCCFWIGVCDFQLNRVQDALLEFQNVFQYEGSEKIAGTYFMIGQCYERLGQRKQAAEIFRKFLSLYPNSYLKSITQQKLLALQER
jgi:TolA-binding protein